MMQRMIGEIKYSAFKEIIASVIHDLKNPLSAITLGLEFIQMNPDGKSVAQALGGAATSAVRIDQLLEALSLYFQDEETPPTAVPVVHMLEKAKLLMGYYLSRRHIRFTIDTKASGQSVLVNLNRAYQGIVMLLIGVANNVLQPAEITVTVVAQGSQQTVRFDVLPAPGERNGDAAGTPIRKNDTADAYLDTARSLFQSTGIDVSLPAGWDLPGSIELAVRTDAAGPSAASPEVIHERQ